MAFGARNLSFLVAFIAAGLVIADLPMDSVCSTSSCSDKTKKPGLVVFVAGGTGAVGRKLIAALLADSECETIIATARGPDITDQSFPGLPENVDRSKLVVLAGVDDYDNLSTSMLGGASVVLTAMGTSRANQEVHADREAIGMDEGFAKWLDRVDFGYNSKLAELALASGAQIFGRVSARGANADQVGGGFNLYFKYQGMADKHISAMNFPKGVIIIRPGMLDRGDELRSKRSWEVENHKRYGPGLNVSIVAERLLTEVRHRLTGDSAGATVVEHQDIVSGSRM